MRNLGKPASHGCVRISPQNATVLYQLVKAAGIENTQVVLSGETPGGEGKVASSTKTRVSSRIQRNLEIALGRMPWGSSSRVSVAMSTLMANHIGAAAFSGVYLAVDKSNRIVPERKPSV